MRKLLLSFILLLLVPSIFLAQGTFKIKGKVTDAKTGEPLIGASVILKPTNLGTMADFNGNYSFEIPISLVRGQKFELIASFVNYKKNSVQITLNETDFTHNFSLEEDILNMQTMVVTGMGNKVAKEKLGVTIDNIAAKEIVQSNEQNIVAALAGKVANVEITSSSGEPGASAYIRIRGAHSITGGTQPLFVVDGSPINNNESTGDVGGVIQQNRASDINPNDIESIDILKGAAASALYGSRAQNGVVLITTKSGKPGKVKVTYDVNYSSDEVTNLPELQNIYAQGTKGVSDLTSTGSWGARIDLTPGAQVYDHQKELFVKGSTVDHNLQISGGNEWTTYFLSLGRNSTDGTIVGPQDYIRNSIRLKASQRITSNFNITGNISYADVSSNRVQKGSNVSGLLLGGWRTPPSFNNLPYLNPVTGFQRSYRYPSGAALFVGRGYDNPFFVANEGVNLTETGRVFGNLKLDWDPLDWVNVSYVLGNDYSNEERRTVIPPSSSAQPTGSVNRFKATTRETDGNLVITASRKFDLFDLNASLMLGQNMNERKYNSFSTTGVNMAVYGFNELNNTSSYTPSEYQSVIRSESYFGQLTLDMFNQLYLTAALRNDGSSTFGASQKRHWYPKFSAAWEVTKLDLMKDVPYLSFTKLRFAYGESGQEPGVYSTFTAFGTSTGAFGDSWGASLTSSPFGYGGFYTSGGKGQENILPQRSKEFEMGLDMGFFQDRLGFELTYYNSKTTDAIFSLPIAPSTGNTSQVQNAGTISNSGIELVLNAQPLNIDNFKWDLRFIYARNKNNVDDLSGAEYISLGGFTSCFGVAMKDYPLPVLRGYDYVRFGRGVKVSGVDIDKTYTGWTSGDLYIAANGYPVQDQQVRVIGDPNPDWTGSISSTFTLFNDFELSFLLDIKQGGNVWDGTRGALLYFGTSAVTLDRGATTVFPGYGPGAGKQVARDQAYYQGVGGSFGGPAIADMEDGSYVKLREISLAYSLRSEYVKEWTGISSIDIRFSARNLHTWTNYTGIDPETNLTGGGNLRGLDYFNNPQTRSYVLSLRLNY